MKKGKGGAYGKRGTKEINRAFSEEKHILPNFLCTGFIDGSYDPVFWIYHKFDFWRRQREQIADLNLRQMRRISDEVDLACNLLAHDMVQSLWTADFRKAMIDPEGTDTSCQSRIVSTLKSHRDNNGLIKDAFLFTSFSELVYSSSGTFLPLEYSNSAKVIHAYLERYTPGDTYLEAPWRVMVQGEASICLKKCTRRCLSG